MISIRPAEMSDKELWHRFDGHLPEEGFAAKVRDGQAYVLLSDDIPAGIMRYNLFWDNTPFCTMLFIGEEFRSRGFGTALMSRRENDMRSLGFGMVMISTQSDESAQHFYRKIGYKDCGGFAIDITGYEQPLEIIMIKKL